MAQRINKPLTEAILDSGNLSSPWRTIGHLRANTIAISVEGIVSGDTLQIEATLAESAAPAAGDIHDHGALITADGIYVVVAGPDRIRGTLTATAGGGDINIRYAGIVAN